MLANQTWSFLILSTAVTYQLFSLLLDYLHLECHMLSKLPGMPPRVYLIWVESTSFIIPTTPNNFQSPDVMPCISYFVYCLWCSLHLKGEHLLLLLLFPTSKSPLLPHCLQNCTQILSPCETFPNSHILQKQVLFPKHLHHNYHSHVFLQRLRMSSQKSMVTFYSSLNLEVLLRIRLLVDGQNKCQLTNSCDNIFIFF